MRKNIKQRRIMFLLILILGLTIGFALLSTNLYINGTANIKGNTWSIHWNSNSIDVTTGSVTATDPVVSTTTSANDTVTFSANLGLPGEFYEFTIDAINEGSIDGELNTLVTKVYDSNDQELTGNNIPSYLIYSVKYSDGTTPSNGDVLKHGRSKKYRIRIEFDNEETEPRSSNESYQIKVTIPYIQRKTIEPVSFSTDSWDTISLNTTSNKYNVGDEKEVEMDIDDDGIKESYTVRIANLSTPDVCNVASYSQTSCGFVVEFVDIAGTHSMNSWGTNAGGWKETLMVTYLNGDFYNKLPSELQSIIIPTYPIVSSSGNNPVPSSDITKEDTTKNKIYLLSAREVGYNYAYDDKRDVTTDTRILDYYAASNNNNRRIKKDLSGTVGRWWLRSAHGGHSATFVNVLTSGAAANDFAQDVYGVAPAFRIGQ